MQRVFNMGMHMNNIPDFVYKRGVLFLQLSSKLEKFMRDKGSESDSSGFDDLISQRMNGNFT